MSSHLRIGLPKGPFPVRLPVEILKVLLPSSIPLCGLQVNSEDEELHSLYRSPNIFRVIKCRRLGWAGHETRMEGGRSAFKVLIGTPTGRRALGGPRHRWEDSIRMDLTEMVIDTRNWIATA